MSIERREYKGSLALGSRTKVMVVSSLDTLTETTQLVADMVSTARSAVELMHGALQPAIAEQRIEHMLILQEGKKKLMEAGLSEEQATACLAAY